MLNLSSKGAPQSPPHILTLVSMAGLAALSMNIFLPSLPEIARDFGVPYPFMQQALTLYLLISALVQITIAPLSDLYGRRPVLLCTFAVFVIASLGTIFAQNATVFLVFRLIQASIATAMVLSRAIVRDIFTEEQAPAQIAYVTMGMSLVPMFAPLIGGILDASFGWRSSFVFILVGGLFVGYLVLRDLGETHPPKPGATLMGQFRSYPKLLKSSRFWVYASTAALSSGAFFAYLGGAPLVGAEHLKLSSLAIGFGFSMPAVGYLIGNFIASRISARIGVDRMVFWGTLTTTAPLIGLAILNLLHIIEPISFFTAMGIVGIGNGFCMPNANAGIVSARPEMAGAASGLGAALMMACGSIMASITAWALEYFASALPLTLIMLAGAALALAIITLHIIASRKTIR